MNTDKYDFFFYPIWLCILKRLENLLMSPK